MNNNLSEQEKKLKEMLEHMEVDFDPRDREKARKLIRTGYPKFPSRVFYLLGSLLLIGTSVAAFYFFNDTEAPVVAHEQRQEMSVEEHEVEGRGEAAEKETERKGEEVASDAFTKEKDDVTTENINTPATPQISIRSTTPAPAKTNTNTAAVHTKKKEMIREIYPESRPGIASLDTKEALKKEQEHIAQTTINPKPEDDKPLAASSVGEEEKQKDKEEKIVSSSQEKQNPPVSLQENKNRHDENLPLIKAPEKTAVVKKEDKEQKEKPAVKKTEEPKEVVKPSKKEERKESASAKVKSPSNNTTGFGVFGGVNYLKQLSSSTDKYTLSPVGGMMITRTIGKQWQLGLRAGYLQQSMAGYAISSVKKVHTFGLNTDSMVFSPQKLQYLQLGLSVAYKLGKWQVYGGFFTNNLLQASGTFATYTKRPYKEEIVTERTEHGYTQGLRSWHATYGLGVGYAITDALRLSAMVSRAATVPINTDYYRIAPKPYQVYELSLYYEIFKSR